MYCILVAGVPATGKGRMAQELSQRLGLPWLSKDVIKEKLYDTVGFRCRAEKVALGEGALEALYYTAGQLLQAGVPCILENNFEEVSKPGLLALLERCQCQAVTVFLTGEPEALYRRFLQRDRSPQRHRGHVVNTQYPVRPGGEPLPPPDTPDKPAWLDAPMELLDQPGPRKPARRRAGPLDEMTSEVLGQLETLMQKENIPLGQSALLNGKKGR